MKKLMMVITAGILFTACQNKQKMEEEIAKAKQATIDSINNVALEKHKQDSIKRAAIAEERNRQEAGFKDASISEEQEPAKKKKGWSSTAKGAVIGAGVGAITGAMVDKKKGEGAVVGGLIGAGAGAGVGAIIDGKKKKQ